MISIETIQHIAGLHQLDPRWVLAFIQVESSGDIYAWRTEPTYNYLWDVKQHKPFRKLLPAEVNCEVAPADFYSLAGSRNTEWLGQQASWGPMQVMGAVAREFGFKDHFPKLCGDIGVEIGCLLIKRLHRSYFTTHGIEGVAAAYNAGSPRILAKTHQYANQEYVDQFSRYLKTALL